MAQTPADESEGVEPEDPDKDEKDSEDAEGTEETPREKNYPWHQRDSDEEVNPHVATHSRRSCSKWNDMLCTRARCR